LCYCSIKTLYLMTLHRRFFFVILAESLNSLHFTRRSTDFYNRKVCYNLLCSGQGLFFDEFTVGDTSNSLLAPRSSINRRTLAILDGILCVRSANFIFSNAIKHPMRICQVCYVCAAKTQRLGGVICSHSLFAEVLALWERILWRKLISACTWQAVVVMNAIVLDSLWSLLQSTDVLDERTNSAFRIEWYVIS
jgi:hypothetical protein